MSGLAYVHVMCFIHATGGVGRIAWIREKKPTSNDSLVALHLNIAAVIETLYITLHNIDSSSKRRGVWGDLRSVVPVRRLLRLRVALITCARFWGA